MKIIFVALVAIMFCCTKNSGQVNKTVSNKAVVSPSATVEVSCDTCALADTIMVTGTGFTAGKIVACAASRLEDGWNLFFTCDTVNADGTIGFEYKYKRPPGSYQLQIWEYMQKNKRYLRGEVSFIVTE